MKTRKLRKVLTAKPYIPSDMLREILSRLPVKSLLRFRCVSKSWLSLVDDDADFSRLHLNNFKNNRDETRFLLVHRGRSDCMVKNSDTNSSSHLSILSLKEWDMVCTVDGLILLSNSQSASNLKLYNPSIKKSLQVPSMPEIDESIANNLAYYTIGFGYSPVVKDYKLVVLVFAERHPKPPSVLIYSLAENSWKKIEFRVEGGVGGSSCSNWPWGSHRCHHRLYFRGCLCFVCHDNDLVFFDLSEEVFYSVAMPETNDVYRCKLGTVDGGGSLAIFDTYGGRKCFIWVLETESKSWMKRRSFGLKFKDFLHLKKNGDVLIRWGDVLIRWGETPGSDMDKRLLMWDEVVSYNPETNKYKIVHEMKSSYYKISHIGGYVESLILHK